MDDIGGSRRGLPLPFRAEEKPVGKSARRVGHGRSALSGYGSCDGHGGPEQAR
jgi:hypothetical protein